MRKLWKQPPKTIYRNRLLASLIAISVFTLPMIVILFAMLTWLLQSIMNKPTPRIVDDIIFIATGVFLVLGLIGTPILFGASTKAKSYNDIAPDEEHTILKNRREKLERMIYENVSLTDVKRSQVITEEEYNEIVRKFEGEQ